MTGVERGGAYDRRRERGLMTGVEREGLMTGIERGGL